MESCRYCCYCTSHRNNFEDERYGDVVPDPGLSVDNQSADKEKNKPHGSGKPNQWNPKQPKKKPARTGGFEQSERQDPAVG